MSIKVCFFGDYPWSGRFYERFNFSQDFDVRLICHSKKQNVKTYFENIKGKHLLNKRLVNFQDAKYDMNNIIKVEKIDLIICVAFSTILKKDFFDSVDVPVLNIHPSLLPSWRGPDPIRRQILNFDDLFGVTLHEMVEQVDAGPIIFQKSLQIKKPVSTSLVLEELYLESRDDLLSAVKDYCNGKRKPIKQKGISSVAPFVKKEELVIKSNENIEVVRRKLILSEGLGYTILDHQGVEKEYKIAELYADGKDVKGIQLRLSNGVLKLGGQIEKS